MIQQGKLCILRATICCFDITILCTSAQQLFCRECLQSLENVMQLSALSASGFALLSCFKQLTIIFQYQPVSQIQEVVCSCPENKDDTLGERFVKDMSLEGVCEEYSISVVGAPLHVFTFLWGITFSVAALALCSYSPCRCRSVREPDQ